VTDYAITFDGTYFRVRIKSGGATYESPEHMHLEDALVWAQKKIGAPIILKISTADDATVPPIPIPLPR
jgi:hypothetical protein